MPVYLIHGFRWLRPAIRIHVIINNIDDAAPEWLVAPATSRALLDNFTSLWPEIMSRLPHLRFIEQYDPEDETTKSQPYAYIANIVHEVDLSADILDLRASNDGSDSQHSLLELRDKVCMGIGGDEVVSWYVVVCGDEERSWDDPPTPTPNNSSQRKSNGTWFDDGGGTVTTPITNSTTQSTVSRNKGEDCEMQRKQTRSISSGLRRLLTRNRSGSDLGRSNSKKSSCSSDMSKSLASLPPNPALPGTAK